MDTMGRMGRPEHASEAVAKTKLELLREANRRYNEQLSELQARCEPEIKPALPNVGQWLVISHFLQQSPQEQPMVDEYRQFVHQSLPEILLTGKHPIVKQIHSQQHKIHFTRVTYFPPSMRTSNGKLLLTSSDKSYERAASLAMAVCVDVLHEREYFRPALTMSQLYRRVCREELGLKDSYIAIKCKLARDEEDSAFVLRNVQSAAEHAKEVAAAKAKSAKAQAALVEAQRAVEEGHRLHHDIAALRRDVFGGAQQGDADDPDLAALNDKLTGAELEVEECETFLQWLQETPEGRGHIHHAVVAPDGADPYDVKNTLPTLVGKDVVAIFKFPQKVWPDGDVNWNDLDLDEPWRVAFVAEQTKWQPYPEYHPLVCVRKVSSMYRQHPLFDCPYMVGTLGPHPYFSDLEERLSANVGSFIINGLSKVLHSQVRLLVNTCFVFPSKKTDKKILLSAECRSLRESTKWNSTSTLTVHLLRKSDRIVVHVPFFTKGKAKIDIPLQIVFLMLGVRSQAQMETYLLPKYCVVAPKLRRYLQRVVSYDWSDVGGTLEDALADYSVFMKKAVASVVSTFHYQLLPHAERRFADGRTDNTAKLLFLGTMVRKLGSTKLGISRYDNRDHAKNKQIQNAGSLLSVLLRTLIKRFKQDSLRTLGKLMEPGKSHDFSAQQVLCSRRRCNSKIYYHFASGHFSLYSQTAGKGYLQVRVDANMQARREQVSTIALPLDSNAKNKEPRDLHGSCYGYDGCSHTPEGSKTGLINSATYMARLTKGVPPKPVEIILCALEKEEELHAPPVYWVLPPTGVAAKDTTTAPENKQRRFRRTPVYINGKVMGMVNGDRRKFVAAVRNVRRRGLLSHEVAVFYDPGMAAVMLQTDTGRRLKPVYIASAIPRLASAFADLRYAGVNIFRELRLRGIVEFISPAEEQELVVATSLEEFATRPSYYTHAALHATSLFSTSVATMPWANMDQGARQIYRSCHGKQVISQARDFYAKFRLASNVNMSLCYGFRSLSKTMIEHVTETPSSEGKSTPMAMMIVELTENQEDALIVSQAAVDRGLGMREVMFVEKVKTCLSAENMVYGRPGPDCSHQRMHVSGRDVYHALDVDGLPRIGARVQKGDVILGRINRIYKRTASGEDVLTLHCASVETSRTGRIYSVSRAECNDFDVVIVRIYALVKPEVGDKLASRHAQKGVIGAIWPQIDMPWSPTFGYADLIINPHAFPSRMTIGQFREMMASKVALLNGKSFADATAYNSDAQVSLEYLQGVLKMNGMCPSGTDVVHSGTTGRRYKCRVCTGFVDYEFLRHIASMKCFARGSKGSTVKQTRQPTRGNKTGGLAVGEMERDANVGHGAAHTFHALAVNNSDPAKCYVCLRPGCGHAVDAPPHSTHMQFADQQRCRMCGGTDFAWVPTSHGNNLLRNELLGCNIKTQYSVSLVDDD